MNTSSQRSVIITGGSGGIGRAAALRLARDGANILVHYNGNSDAARETADAVVKSGGTAIVFGADVAAEGKMQQMFVEAAAAFGGVDVLVHTAGIMPPGPHRRNGLEDL